MGFVDGVTHTGPDANDDGVKCATDDDIEIDAPLNSSASTREVLTVTRARSFMTVTRIR